jgi:hypothetical protein
VKNVSYFGVSIAQGSVRNERRQPPTEMTGSRLIVSGGISCPPVETPGFPGWKREAAGFIRQTSTLPTSPELVTNGALD